jgi:glutaredoxin
MTVEDMYYIEVLSGVTLFRHMEVITRSVVPTQETLGTEEALVSDETDALQKASSLSDFVQNRQGVLLLSKTSCQFCLELKRTLQSFGVHYTVVEADKTGKINEICKEMHKLYDMSTFPVLVIDGTKVGGCTDCKTFEFSGEFQSKLASYVTKDIPPEEKYACFTILYFPETVNNWAVRSTGTLSMIYAVLCTAFWNHRATKWAVLAIAIDYSLRIIFGGAGSPVGMLGAALVSSIPPDFVAGPPKQFAACCGWFMTALSAALYLSGEPIGGAVMIALLIPPAAMEGLLDFCLVRSNYNFLFYRD